MFRTHGVWLNGAGKHRRQWWTCDDIGRMMYENGDVRDHRGYYSWCLMRYILGSILLIKHCLVKDGLFDFLKTRGGSHNSFSHNHNRPHIYLLCSLLITTIIFHHSEYSPTMPWSQQYIYGCHLAAHNYNYIVSEQFSFYLSVHSGYSVRFLI